MAFEMIHRDERKAEGVSETLGTCDADEQRADEARPGGDGDAIDVVERHLRVVESACDERKQMLQMLPRGDLRNHAAERAVPLDLRGDQIDPHRAGVVQHGDRRFVAGSLDSQNHVRSSQLAVRGVLCELRSANCEPATYNPALYQ